MASEATAKIAQLKKDLKSCRADFQRLKRKYDERKLWEGGTRLARSLKDVMEFIGGVKLQIDRNDKMLEMLKLIRRVSKSESWGAEKYMNVFGNGTIDERAISDVFIKMGMHETEGEVWETHINTTIEQTAASNALLRTYYDAAVGICESTVNTLKEILELHNTAKIAEFLMMLDQLSEKLDSAPKMNGQAQQEAEKGGKERSE